MSTDPVPHAELMVAFPSSEGEGFAAPITTSNLAYVVDDYEAKGAKVVMRDPDGNLVEAECERKGDKVCPTGKATKTKTPSTGGSTGGNG